MPQRPYSGVVQPQNSMIEALLTITLLLTIDRMARSCRPSSKSRSSELLLVLRKLFGAAVLPLKRMSWHDPSTLRNPTRSWTGTRTHVTRVYPAWSWRQPATWKVRPSASRHSYTYLSTPYNVQLPR